MEDTEAKINSLKELRKEINSWRKESTTRLAPKPEEIPEEDAVEVALKRLKGKAGR